MKNFLSKVFIIFGISFLLLFGYLMYLKYAEKPLTFERKPQVSQNLGSALPARVEIPSIKVDLPTIPSIIRNNFWETTSIGVSYLSSSPIPGEKGNSVMYGHNWTSLLGKLPDVKPGQKITVVMQNGQKRDFKVAYTATVSPNQTSIIGSTNDSRLTIYTCVGFLDSKRFVVVAKPATL